MADVSPSPQPTGQLVTTKRAAELCGVHPNTIRRYIADGRLPAYRIGDRLIRVDVDAVAELIVRA